MLKIILAILFIARGPVEPVPTTDYRTVFGTDYAWAASWLHSHRAEMKSTAARFGVPAAEISAIVFPELIRYNNLFDAIQIESLKFLYVSEGKKYSDFSVGYFQMKPSFAETVEGDAAKLTNEPLLHSCLAEWLKAADTESARSARVRRITNVGEQLIYLCAFYKICSQRFPLSRFMNAAERVRFFATCYNAGYRRSITEVERFQRRNDFFNYNYATVSGFYFVSQAKL